MIRIIPVVLVVYKSKNSNWRGFCVPYDVACTTKTKKEAFKVLQEMVDLYEKGLKKYNFPEHLLNKESTDKEDRLFFKEEIWPRISKVISREIEKFNDYVEFLNADNTMKKHKHIVKSSAKHYEASVERRVPVFFP